MEGQTGTEPGGSGNRSALIFIGIVAVAALIGGGIALSGGGGDDEDSSGSLPSGCEQVDEPAAKNVQLKAPPLDAPPAGTTATVSTSCGDFVITLDTERAPKTSASFVYMADQGVYDETAFLRIAPGFVIQGGDPTATQGGNAGYTVDEAPPSDLVYAKGVVAMAKSGAEPPGRSGSQFFVVIAPADAGLPPDYALLGTVTSGFEVVEAIAGIGTETGSDGPPKEPVVIEKVTVAPGK